MLSLPEEVSNMALFSLINFTGLTHSMTDAPLLLGPKISGCGYETI